MKVLVCGGRDYYDRTRVFQELNKLHAQTPLTKVIHGAARGADSLADVWGTTNGVPVERFPADWNTYGRSAGYHRNKLMLDAGKPDLVVAFPGGRGTEMMMNLTLEAGVQLLAVR